MPKKSASRKRLDSLRHPAIMALDKVKIGPIFPSWDELKGILRGMRGVRRKKTASPFNDAYRKKRRLKNRGR